MKIIVKPFSSDMVLMISLKKITLLKQQTIFPQIFQAFNNLTEFTRPFFTGGLDQIGFQSDSGHSHQLDRPQSPAVSNAQRPQHLEVTCDQRAEE